jgi:hypothetical protein
VAELEVSKLAQHAALRRAGCDVPSTIAVADLAHLVPAASGFATPFIVNQNQGGKGLGVRRFDAVDELAVEVESEGIDLSPDGITLVQEYLRSGMHQPEHQLRPRGGARSSRTCHATGCADLQRLLHEARGDSTRHTAQPVDSGVHNLATASIPA